MCAPDCLQSLCPALLSEGAFGEHSRMHQAVVSSEGAAMSQKSSRRRLPWPSEPGCGQTKRGQSLTPRNVSLRSPRLPALVLLSGCSSWLRQPHPAATAPSQQVGLSTQENMVRGQICRLGASWSKQFVPEL